MNKDPKFEEMLNDYILNELSASDFIAFMQEVRNGHHDELTKQKIDFLLSSGEYQIELPPGRAQDILLNIQMMERQTSEVISLERSWKITHFWIAASIALIAGVTGWLMLPQKTAPKPSVAKRMKKENKPPEPSGKKYLSLPDGSVVILNENSELHYPAQFNGSVREVTLVGEAFFDIKHDDQKPFIVHTAAINTTVLGTAFNIKAFPGQHNITVTVTRGKVRVSNKQRIYSVLTANQQLSINTENNDVVERIINADSATTWKKFGLVINDVTLDDAVNLIAYKYHMNIVIIDQELKQKRVNATFLEQESLENVLEILCGTVDATFEQKKNNYIIFGNK